MALYSKNLCKIHAQNSQNGFCINDDSVIENIYVKITFTRCPYEFLNIFLRIQLNLLLTHRYHPFCFTGIIVSFSIKIKGSRKRFPLIEANYAPSLDICQVFSFTLFCNISEINIPIAQICNRYIGSYALFYYCGSSETTCTGKIISLISYEFQNHFVNYSHLELASDTFRQSMPYK